MRWDGGRLGRWLIATAERRQARSLSRFDVIALRVIWIMVPVGGVVALLAGRLAFALTVLVCQVFAGFGMPRHQWDQVLGRNRR